MGKFYTEEQVREAIAALESYSPGIWERMKTLARIKGRHSHEQEAAQGDIVRVAGKVLPTMSFVMQAEDPDEAKMLLSLDVGDAVGADIDREDAKLPAASKND
jgi:hypothetical protein